MSLTARTRSVAVIVLAFSSICLSVRAQGPPAQVTRPLVKVRVSLIDRRGRAVTDAKKEDFQVSDDGSAAEIEYFAKDQEPLAYGLVIDGSGSLKPIFPTIVAAARQLIAANQDRDQAFIIKFVSSDNVRTVQEFTTNKGDLDMSLSRLKLEGGQTALIDGVYLAVEYAMKHNANRPTALVLLSDGEDRQSYYQQSKLFSLLEGSAVQIFAIGMIGNLDSDHGLVRASSQQQAEDLLTKLAKQTGGLAFILKSQKELPTTVEQLGQIMRSTYVIGYRPTKNLNDTKRAVKIKIADSPQHEKWTVAGSRIVAIEQQP
jgi:VWFA-related protein